MNSKKAKRLRQLVKHLQAREAIPNTEWDKTNTGEPLGKAPWMFKGQHTLHPESGKAVYKQMKKRADLHGKGKI